MIVSGWFPFEFMATKGILLISEIRCEDYIIRDNSQCCQQVPAEYTGYRTNYGAHHRFYVPVFSYEWKNCLLYHFEL